MKDPRFRVTDPIYFYSVAFLDLEEMRESDRLDNELGNRENGGHWWVVSVYEWESGLD
jgi:hypothetical protein